MLQKDPNVKKYYIMIYKMDFLSDLDGFVYSMMLKPALHMTGISEPTKTKTSHAEFNNANTKYDQPLSNPKY